MCIACLSSLSKKIGRHTQEKGLHLHFTLFVVVVVGFKKLHLLRFSYASCSNFHENKMTGA